MRYRFLLASQTTSTLALLGALLTGCAVEDDITDEAAEVSIDDEHAADMEGTSTAHEALTRGKRRGAGASPKGKVLVTVRPPAKGGSTGKGSSTTRPPARGGSTGKGSSTTRPPARGGSTTRPPARGGTTNKPPAKSGDARAGLFKHPHPWTKDVSRLAAHPRSPAITGWLADAGGWGSGVMRIDFGITILEATSSTPKRSFIPTDEFYSPDCDHVPFPVPPGGALESEEGYECTNDGDCHLLVVHRDENKLYEMWRANITGGTFYGGCAAVWDLNKLYPSDLRGDGCSSADAGGFPITAMMFTPEEVQRGAIEHAIRFILPNSRIREGVYVRPGTHSTRPTSGGEDAPPYGVRFRLRSDYPLGDLPSDGARVIARAMQKYGMFLADGGTIALSGASDRFSSVKWEDLGVGPRSLQQLSVEDFEVVDMGEPIEWDGECARNR